MKVRLLIAAIILAVGGVIAANSFGLFNPRENVTQNTTLPPSLNSQYNDWRQQTVPHIGLSLQIPPDMTYREELADDYGNIRTMAFYIESKDQSKPAYQLYGLFQADKESSDQDLERSKTEMDKTTIKETSIDGYQGIEGLILGPKTRYITVIQKDERLFSVSTYPPTQENKKLTVKIVQTFDFQ